MSGNSMVMAMRETLFTQQKLLHNIYTELEAEREASATAASEALSMILRLQGEKAAEKLEASQFKRMTQEKMNHAQELMLLFDDLVHHKEMEITSLHFQLQAYRYKMLSLGLTDSEIRDMESHDSPFLPQNQLHSGRDLPAIQYDRETSDIALDETSTPTQIGLHDHDYDYDYELDVQCKDAHRKSEESATGDHLISYWEQIKELDERVEKLSHANFQGVDYHRASSFPKESPSTSNYSITGNHQRTFSCSSSQTYHSAIPCLEETQDTGSASQSMSIHDVFEVPQNNTGSSDDKFCPPQAQQGKKLVVEEENRLGKPDPIPHGAMKYYSRDGCEDNENKWTKPREGISVNCHLALVDLTNDKFPFQTDFQQLNKRLEMLEDERGIVKQGVSCSAEENLRLLKEIHEQLDTIRSEIRCTKPESYPVAADEPPSLVSLMEARFFYSL